MESECTLAMVAKVVAAYVSNNPVPMTELPGLVKSVHGTMNGLRGGPTADSSAVQKPAVPVRKSVGTD